MSRLLGNVRKDRCLNPHVAQVYLNSPCCQYWVTPEFRRILRIDSAPERRYDRGGDQVRTTVHWGQRKLLLSEIEFFTLVGLEQLEDATVVYAGAASGTHIAYLADIFPTVKFVLVDPAPFTVKGSDRIRIMGGLFTDELAVDLKRQYGPRIFFFSDIRTADPDRDSPQQSEIKIQSDMAEQMRWHLLLGSDRSMLKFRLPWDKGSSEYLDGDIYLPVWGPHTTTECRLITKKGEPGAVREYDHKKYERQMCHFNWMTRVSLYQHDVTGTGLDHCYDCTAEIHILKAYIMMYNPSIPPSEVNEKVAEMSKRISNHLSHIRTLCDPSPDKEQRKNVIRKRQYSDDGRIPAHEAWGRNAKPKFDDPSPP